MALMLSVRSIIADTSPPPIRTSADNHATLLVSWWCTIFALVIILTRVFGRYVRTERLFTEDKIMAWSIIPLMTRMALVHVVLLFGTNNTQLQGLTAQDIHQRSIGSRVVLASRIFYALFIWTAKFTVSEFLKRITSNTWNRAQEITLKVIRGFLVVTFLGVVIGTLAECQPFDHYWQVTPDPGSRCRNGYAQLLTMGTSDVITDVLLIAFPMPVILMSAMPVKRKISLCLLFALSLILLVIAAYRMPAIINMHGSQQRRTLWASIEILAAAAVSNSVIIGSFVRDRGVKKARYRVEVTNRTDSAGQPSINRTLTHQHWGNDSDHELFRACGGRLDSVAGHEDLEPTPRPPKQVEPLPPISSSKDEKTGWRVKNQDLSVSDSSSEQRDFISSSPHNLPDGRHASQQMSFFDIGGILERDPSHLEPVSTESGRYVTGFRDFGDMSAAIVSRTSEDWVEDSTPNATEMTNEQASAGAQEDEAQLSQYRLQSQIEGSSFSQSSQAGLNNGRPAETEAKVDLHDAGGLLS